MIENWPVDFLSILQQPMPWHYQFCPNCCFPRNKSRSWEFIRVVEIPRDLSGRMNQVVFYSRSLSYS
jgi:hypothetical protein